MAVLKVGLATNVVLIYCQLPSFTIFDYTYSIHDMCNRISMRLEFYGC